MSATWLALLGHYQRVHLTNSNIEDEQKFWEIRRLQKQQEAKHGEIPCRDCQAIEETLDKARNIRSKDSESSGRSNRVPHTIGR